MYQYYKQARDRSWQVLLETKINTLPVSLSRVAEHYGIKVISYATVGIEPKNEDGFCTLYKGQYIIFYNPDKSQVRIRFTLAHELGHCLLGHLSPGETTNRHNTEADTYTDPQEIQANVFARDLLMPATVLHSLNVQSPEEIMRICNVSKQSAEIRYKRLLELNKRGMYNKHPLERQVYNQFFQ